MDMQKQREILEEKLNNVLEQIKTVGVSADQNPGGFVATEGEQNTVTGDDEDTANEMTDFGTNNAILKQLEDRAVNIKKALENVENGTYGKCLECEADIEQERLDALPSAATCMKCL